MPKPRQGRKGIAHGASRGALACANQQAPEGRKRRSGGIFRPAGAGQNACRCDPTACAVGCLLAPLRGWLGCVHSPRSREEPHFLGSSRLWPDAWFLSHVLRDLRHGNNTIPVHSLRSVALPSRRWNHIRASPISANGKRENGVSEPLFSLLPRTVSHLSSQPIPPSSRPYAPLLPARRRRSVFHAGMPMTASIIGLQLPPLNTTRGDGGRAATGQLPGTDHVGGGPTPVTGLEGTSLHTWHVQKAPMPDSGKQSPVFR